MTVTKERRQSEIDATERSMEKTMMSYSSVVLSYLVKSAIDD